MTRPRVALFVTCLADQFFPRVGESAVAVLRHAGAEIVFNPDQTCCGQPAFNLGYRSEARAVAGRMLDLFAGADYIVAPSGSCTSMVRVFYQELFGHDPSLRRKAEVLGRRFYELSEFLVRVMKIEELGARFPHRVAYHDSCHLLRELGASDEPRRLIRAVREIDLVELGDERACCGFGGAFSVKFPEISVALADDKLREAEAAGAEYLVSCDCGCLMHLAGRIQRRGVKLKTLHLAELLAMR